HCSAAPRAGVAWRHWVPVAGWRQRPGGLVGAICRLWAGRADYRDYAIVDRDLRHLAAARRAPAANGLGGRHAGLGWTRRAAVAQAQCWRQRVAGRSGATGGDALLD